MTKHDNGEPAFPITAGNAVYCHGMTLRDWFAGQALANRYTQDENNEQNVAKWAYLVADTMIAERGQCYD